MFSNSGILIFFHCGSNIGYAIESLENVFVQTALKITNDFNSIHFAYPDLTRGKSKLLPAELINIIQFDPASRNIDEMINIQRYVELNNIQIALGFDQPVYRQVYKFLRRGGVKLLISYWGAPMSGLNHGLKLLTKQMEVFFKRYKPDLFVFESESMAEFAIRGRGIQKKTTEIVYLGVDEHKFKPDPKYADYAYDLFKIPKKRKIFFYSGHMEERKGVSIILQAAVEMTVTMKREDVHFLLLGNKNDEEKCFDNIYKNTSAEKYVTFAGYRDDICFILPSCYAGIIASTGWDSFTMSSIEMASSGLPLIVSDLQGLRETVEDTKTGFLFEKGNVHKLAKKIRILLDNKLMHDEMAVNARERVVNKFTKDKQIGNLCVAIMERANRLKVY